MNPLAQLADQIAAHFNLSEVQDLCFELDINFENLEGSTLDYKTRELVRYCRRHQRLPELLTRLSQQRPIVAWPAPTEISARPEQPIDKPRPTLIFRRSWPMILLLVVVAILIWRLWPTSPPLASIPTTGSPADIPRVATSRSSSVIATPTGQVSPSPTHTVETTAAVLDSSSFATEPPFVTLLSENRLVASPGKSLNPALFGDPGGGLHLAWWDNTTRQGTAGDLFYQYRSPAGNWGEIERLTNETLAYISEYETALRWRPDGVICIFFADVAAGLQQKCRENGVWTPLKVIREGFITESDPQMNEGGQPFVVYRALADDIWFEDTQLSDGLNGGRSPKFVIDSMGIFHVVWFSTEGGPYRLLHRQSGDSGITWSEAVAVTSEAPVPDIPFTLYADATGRVHLVWHGFSGGHYYKVWSADDGWSQVETLPGLAQNNCTSVDLQITSEGELFFSWQGGEGIFVTARPPGKDQPWETPFQVSPRICRGFGPILTTLPDQRIFLVYSDQEDDQIDLYGAELVAGMAGSP